MIERTCRLCRTLADVAPLGVCEPCRTAIGVETYDALVALEMRLNSGRDVPKPLEYSAAWREAREKAGVS
jgi:hypothetical protein